MSRSGESPKKKPTKAPKKTAEAASQASAKRTVKRTIKPKTAAVAGPTIPPEHLSVVTHEAIRHRAYLKWEAAGRPEGDGVHFWLEAQQELLQGT